MGPTYCLQEYLTMAPKEKKTKAQIAAAAAAGGKRGKKKWQKDKVKEKSNVGFYFDANCVKKVNNEVPKMKMITLGTLRDKLQLSGSLCKEVVRVMESQGKIERVAKKGNFYLFSKITEAEAAPVPAAEVPATTA